MASDGCNVFVEYRQQADGTQKFWWVSRDEHVFAIDQTFNGAVDFARRLATSDDCKVWLIGHGEPIEITTSHLPPLPPGAA